MKCIKKIKAKGMKMYYKNNNDKKKENAFSTAMCSLHVCASIQGN